MELLSTEQYDRIEPTNHAMLEPTCHVFEYRRLSLVCFVNSNSYEMNCVLKTCLLVTFGNA